MTLDVVQYCEVQLEIGHRATPKTKQSAEGHTHDWTVFVRGPENSNIQHFVERVVFHLHDSFPKPKRVVKEPPYQVSESGYASFELPVEVYFKNKEEPKKICFDYDLYLRLDDAVSHSRREKLTFQNPSNDFKKKLLKAGGVTNESSGSATKTATTCDEKQQTQQTSTSNSTAKYSKASLSGNESKRSKTSSVIPSKDKSLNNSQNSTTTSSSIPPVVPEKHAIPSSNNKQFTDLFGPPIQARPPTDSVAKNKENSLKNKCTAIASKGVKNDSKPLLKNSSKSSYSSPSHKNIESKSTKDTKDSKVGAKSKENTKSKRSEEMAANKSKKKNTQSPKPHESTEKKSDFKASKKRRNSTSSNSSSLTGSSFGGSTESKLHKESQKLGSIKEKDKKESKKQKVSSKDMNTASGVKKQSSTSTKISFSNNNSSTTIEIKSVKKEKTWDKEVKKSRSKEFKSSEYKAAKDKVNTNTNTSSASLSSNKTKSKPELNCLKSPKVNGNKHLKAPKEKYISSNRARSSSPSSGSLTPGGVVVSSPSIHGPINSIAADIESHESMSPLSSDNTSPALGFVPIRTNQTKSDTNNSFISDDSDTDHSSKQSPKRNSHSNKTSHSRDSQQINKNKANDSSKSQTKKRKTDSSKDSNKRLDQSINDRTITPGPDFDDSMLLNDLIDMQKKLNESTNTDLLQKIVDIIEESGPFLVTKTTFDFDLMKLDDKTIRKLKTYLS